jgi:hypothetical protein
MPWRGPPAFRRGNFIAHRLSLEITRPHAAVWKAFTGEIHSWWPKDFYATESPQRIVF